MTTVVKIQPAKGTWVVRAGGAVLGETENALEIREGSYPPVIYFPRADIGMDFFDISDHETICPHKGKATYFTFAAKSGAIENVAWSYEDPVSEVKEIAGHLAFYPDKVIIEEV